MPIRCRELRRLAFFYTRILPAIVLSSCFAQTSLADTHQLPQSASSQPNTQICESYNAADQARDQSQENCAENHAFVTTNAVLSGAVLFSYNSNELSAGGLKALQKLIKDLNSFKKIKAIRIVGHTDSSGPEAYNQYLSELRAHYIGELFKTAFPTSRITTAGRGESAPIAKEDTWFGRYQNRRVEIEVTAMK